MAAIKKGIIQLEPLRHEAPFCGNYEDIQAVTAFEKRMRTHRAHTEPFEVQPPLARVDGTWRVSSASGTSYLVDILDGSESHDACTCPDFLGNGLGICKHMEAVRRTIRGRPAMARSFRALSAAPALPAITVEAMADLALKPIGPWTPALLAECGLFYEPGTGELLLREGRTLRPGETGPRVAHAAPLVLEWRRMQRHHEQRREAFLGALDEGRADVDVLNHPLFPYQREGVQHLASRGRALLADDMGLGKTVQAIAACEVLMARGEASRVVVVTPASLKHQWASEIERYTGRKAAVVGGGAMTRAEAMASKPPYLILSYELTWRELHRLKDLDADILILDEAQRAKNFRTKTAATLRAIPSRFLFVLTGTPIENRLDDLYSLLQLVDPGILGPLWKFNLDFHRQGPRGKVLGCKNMGQLREIISPVLLRRRKEEVLHQLPALTEQTRYTALSSAQKNMEEGWRGEAAKYMAMAEKRPLTLKEMKLMQMALLKARQACDALELCDPGSKQKASPKLDEFEALVAEITTNGTSKILVFSEWVEMLKLASQRLDKLGVGWSMLTGQVPTEKRPALLDRFRSDPSRQVLLSSDAGGVGLNLQVASYVIHLDLPWNPARLDQRTSRAHRLGQTRGVSVTYLCAESGIERGIEGTLAGKRAVRSAALDVNSEVDALENMSFSVLLRQMRDVVEALAEPDAIAAIEADVMAETEEAEIQVAEVRAPSESAQIQASPSPVISASIPGSSRAQDRLRLAKVVLEAGFPADAMRACYESLAAALTALLEEAPPPGHASLVAAIYRDLLPAGRIPMAAPALLARLHDLTTLEAHGVGVDPSLARGSLAEAEQWVERLGTLNPVPAQVSMNQD